MPKNLFLAPDASPAKREALAAYVAASDERSSRPDTFKPPEAVGSSLQKLQIAIPS